MMLSNGPSARLSCASHDGSSVISAKR
jgi:hypothetical protein